MLKACKLFSVQFALPHTTNCCGIQSHKYARGKKNKVINYFLPNFRAIAQDNEDNQKATVSEHTYENYSISFSISFRITTLTLLL